MTDSKPSDSVAAPANVQAPVLLFGGAPAGIAPKRKQGRFPKGSPEALAWGQEQKKKRDAKKLKELQASVGSEKKSEVVAEVAPVAPAVVPVEDSAPKKRKREPAKKKKFLEATNSQQENNERQSSEEDEGDVGEALMDSFKPHVEKYVVKHINKYIKKTKQQKAQKKQEAEDSESEEQEVEERPKKQILPRRWTKPQPPAKRIVKPGETVYDDPVFVTQPVGTRPAMSIVIPPSPFGSREF